MVFDSKEWKSVARHSPLINPEIAKLRQEIQDSAQVAYHIILWAESIQKQLRYWPLFLLRRAAEEDRLMENVDPQLLAILFPPGEDE